LTLLASLPRRLIVSHGAKSHYTDGHGRLLCDPHRTVAYTTQTLDLAPTCGWCKLIGKEEP
jgi:hypothetical protein